MAISTTDTGMYKVLLYKNNVPKKQ